MVGKTSLQCTNQMVGFPPGLSTRIEFWFQPAWSECLFSGPAHPEEGERLISLPATDRSPEQLLKPDVLRP